jgi:hypothetical protein
VDVLAVDVVQLAFQHAVEVGQFLAGEGDAARGQPLQEAAECLIYAR